MFFWRWPVQLLDDACTHVDFLFLIIFVVYRSVAVTTYGPVGKLLVEIR